MGELKPGWRRVKFGEVVRLGKERCAPGADGIERYIGLEHIEPGDLRVRSWGDVSDGTTFTTRVRPGHVLFGKRRAYQRKVAVADFDAVCSGDIYVFESANPAKLMPELLPFLCQTDAFFDYAVGTSAGSLSPRTNWTSLAEYEFALPPLDEQRRLHRLLSHWTRAVDAHRDLLDAATALSNAVILGALWPGTKADWIDGDLGAATAPPGWTMMRAEALSTDLVTKGATPPGELSGLDRSGIPFLKVYNLTFDGRLDFSVDPTWISPAGHRELRRSTIREGDVLMNIVGPPLGKVSTVPVGFPESNINQAIVRYRPRTRHLGEWLEAYLLSPIAQNWLLRRSKKTSGQRNLTLELCRELPVPVPDDIESQLLRVRAGRDGVRGAQNRLESARVAASRASVEALHPPIRGEVAPPEATCEVHDA